MSFRPKRSKFLTVPDGKRPKEPQRKTHYAEDGIDRYCNDKLKGKDEWVREWALMDCKECRLKRRGTRRIMEESRK